MFAYISEAIMSVVVLVVLLGTVAGVFYAVRPK